MCAVQAGDFLGMGGISRKTQFAFTWQYVPSKSEVLAGYNGSGTWIFVDGYLNQSQFSAEHKRFAVSESHWLGKKSWYLEGSTKDKKLQQAKTKLGTVSFLPTIFEESGDGWQS